MFYLIMKLFLMILVLEVYKFFDGYYDWDRCYKYGKIHSYSEFIYYTIPRLKFNIFYFIIFCFLYYYLLLINIFFFVLFFSIPLKCNKKNLFSAIIFYYPYLLSLALKKIIKERLFKINIFKNIILNFSSLFLFGFPRIVIHYSYTSSTILISYKKTSARKDKNLKEFINYLYENTYGESINKIEAFLKYPI